MKVQVYHQTEPFVANTDFEHVADVDVSDYNLDEDVTSLLEVAFFRTQNINGSWSRPAEYEDGDRNPDYHPSVTVIKPLHIDENLKIWGHRSSMVGDRFVIDGKTYEVDTIGFKEVEG